MRPELLVTGLLCLLAGCASVPGRSDRASDTASSGEALQAAQLMSLASLVSSLHTVVNGTPTEQAEVMADAARDFEQARQGPAALRYGLLLAAPGHPGRDPERAQQVLREALAYPGLLNPQESAFGAVELERIRAELRLAAENQRLVSEIQQDRDRQRNGQANGAATRQQLQAALEQNAALRKERDEALAKLNAIAEFERRQADRPPASERTNP